jgi:hypothetical protein
MAERDADVLTRAAVLLGGVPRLAQRLSVSAEDVLAWIGNQTPAPEDVLANAKAIVRAYEIDRTGTRLIRLEALKKQKELMPK